MSGRISLRFAILGSMDAKGSSSHHRQRRPIVRVPLLVALVLVSQAAEQAAALARDLRRVEAQVLAFRHLDGDRPEVLEPGRAAEGAAADADAADQSSLVTGSHLHHLHPHRKTARKIAYQ